MVVAAHTDIAYKPVHAHSWLTAAGCHFGRHRASPPCALGVMHLSKTVNLEWSVGQGLPSSRSTTSCILPPVHHGLAADGVWAGMHTPHHTTRVMHADCKVTAP